MLNEEKIKQMTDIALFEQKEGEYMAPVRRYFRGDYITRNLVRAFVGYSFCWALGVVMVFAYELEDIFTMTSLDILELQGFEAILVYIAGLTVYLLITAYVYVRRYSFGSRAQKVYLAKLNRLEDRYEYQSRPKDRSRGGRRS